MMCTLYISVGNGKEIYIGLEKSSQTNEGYNSFVIYRETHFPSHSILNETLKRISVKVFSFADFRRLLYNFFECPSLARHFKNKSKPKGILKNSMSKTTGHLPFVLLKSLKSKTRGKKSTKRKRTKKCRPNEWKLWEKKRNQADNIDRDILKNMFCGRLSAHNRSWCRKQPAEWMCFSSCGNHILPKQYFIHKFTKKNWQTSFDGWRTENDVHHPNRLYISNKHVRVNGSNLNPKPGVIACGAAATVNVFGFIRASMGTGYVCPFSDDEINPLCHYLHHRKMFFLLLATDVLYR